MTKKRKPGGMSPSERQHLRMYGTHPDTQASTIEQMLYRVCVQYRLTKFYHETEVDVIKMLRLMIRSFAVTVVWKKGHGKEIVLEEDVKALEREFLRRAKEDPPF